MSIEGAIKVAEKANVDLAAKKEAERIKNLKPEDIKAEESKAAEAKKLAENKAILEAKDETLDADGKKRKSEIIEAEKKRVAEDDSRILKAKDEELSAEEKKKKVTLVQKAKEDKEAEKEAKIQSRIDEIAGELKAEKALRAKDQEKIAALETEQKKLKGITEKPKIEDQAEKLEKDRILKYTESDKALPRDKRREMDDQELEEWLMEDMVSAQRWLSKQELRRDKEKTADIGRLMGGGDADVREKAEFVIQKQKQSQERVTVKYPDIAKQLNVNSRIQELKSEGKTKEEISQIIAKERPATKIVAEILREDGDTYLLSENGPELLAEEVMKRMGKKVEKGESQDERDARIVAEALEAERERQAKLPENLRSNGVKKTEKNLSDLEKDQWELFKKNFPKKTFADFESMQERRIKSGA